MRSFEHSTGASRVVFGAGTLRQVGAELALLGGSRALVLSTPRRASSPTGSSRSSGRWAGTFDGAVMHTPVEVTERALQEVRALDADSLVSIGGGSTTGLGKAIASGPDCPTWSCRRRTPAPRSRRSWVRPPTARRPPAPVRRSCRTPWSTTSSSPRACPGPSRSPARERHGPRGRGALRSRAHRRDRRDGRRTPSGAGHRAAPSPAEPDSLDARADLLFGAWRAGICLAAVGMGLHHKLCHTLGGTFGLPHAPTHTVVLPHVDGVQPVRRAGGHRSRRAALGLDDAPAGLQVLVDALGRTDLVGRARASRSGRAASRRARDRPSLPEPPRELTPDDVTELLSGPPTAHGSEPTVRSDARLTSPPRPATAAAADREVRGQLRSGARPAADAHAEPGRHLHAFVMDNDLTEDEWRRRSTS